MRIFLSSTVYDLIDFRDLAVDRLERMGHEVIYHESPLFPVRPDLHSHDQCITMVDACDLFLCILDRRYGGKYSGGLSHLFPDQHLEVRSGGRRQRITYAANDLSITWCEWIRARDLNRPIMTFARQRLFDEKATRRANQHLKSFKPSYAERNEIFDFVDWITKQKRYNWIIPYQTIVDFESKLLSWVKEYEKAHVPPAKRGGGGGGAGGGTGAGPKPKGGPASGHGSGIRVRVLVLVEGPDDQALVSFLVRSMQLDADVTIVPTFGKIPLLQHFYETVEGIGGDYESIAVVFDADTTDPGSVDAQREQLRRSAESLEGIEINIFPAVPTAESWMSQLFGPWPEETTKEIKRRFHRQVLRESTQMLVMDYSVLSNVSDDLAAFLEYLLRFSTTLEDA